MDPIYAAKLLKYPPADVQSVTYIVEYAQHNCEDVKEVHEYIESKLKTDRLIEIADIILENKNMATIKAKPSAASAKIDSVKEKQTTEGPVTATQRSISTKASGASPKTEEVIKEEEADRLKDRRMERGGVGGNQRYGSSASSNQGAKKYDPEKSRAASKKALDMVRAQITAKYGKDALVNSFNPETTGEDLEETTSVDEAYKEIDKKKENAMYRRAGNLARTSLSSKGKKKEDAQNKSAKIVSAITRQKENERFERIGKDPKHQNNYKEEVENVEEIYKGKHGQSDKEYADSRSQGGKMVSGDSKMSGAEYTHGRRVKAANPGMQPDVGGKTKPKSQGKMDKGTRADLQYRKANMRKEEASMSPQELQLQKRKAMVDRMIAQKRQQSLNKAKKTEPPAKAMGEATEDSLRDRRMERGGVDGNVRYDRAPKPANTAGKKKPYDGMSALEKVKASIRAKHGQGAIMDTKKK